MPLISLALVLILSIDLDLVCEMDSQKLLGFPADYEGWFYQKNSILIPLFDHLFQRLSEDGFLHRMQKIYLTPDSPSCKDESVMSIGFNLVILLFVFLALGVISSLVILFAEKTKAYIS